MSFFEVDSLTIPPPPLLTHLKQQSVLRTADPSVYNPSGITYPWQNLPLRQLEEIEMRNNSKGDNLYPHLHAVLQDARDEQKAVVNLYYVVSYAEIHKS